MNPDELTQSVIRVNESNQKPCNLKDEGDISEVYITQHQPDKQYQAHIVIVQKSFKTSIAVTIRRQSLLMDKEHPRQRNRPVERPT